MNELQATRLTTMKRKVDNKIMHHSTYKPANNMQYNIYSKMEYGIIMQLYIKISQIIM